MTKLLIALVLLLLAGCNMRSYHRYWWADDYTHTMDGKPIIILRGPVYIVAHWDDKGVKRIVAVDGDELEAIGTVE